MGVFCMATSSITHNFIISNPVEAERYANALEEAENNKIDLKPTMGTAFAKTEDILEILKKRKEKVNGK